MVFPRMRLLVRPEARHGRAQHWDNSGAGGKKRLGMVVGTRGKPPGEHGAEPAAFPAQRIPQGAPSAPLPPSLPRQPHFLPRSFALPRFYHKAQKFAGSCCCSARKLWVFQPRGFADLRDGSDPLGKAFPSLHKHQIPTPAHFFRTKRAGRGQVPARM